MEKILLPVDLAHGDKSEALIKEAMKYAAGREVNFTMLHVVSPIPGYMTAELPELFAEKSVENAKGMLDRFAREHGSAIRAQTMVRIGVAQHEIVAVAGEIGADLIIIASHKPEAADYLLGSTASAVVRHAPCSVLVHR